MVFCLSMYSFEFQDCFMVSMALVIYTPPVASISEINSPALFKQLSIVAILKIKSVNILFPEFFSLTGN